MHLSDEYIFGGENAMIYTDLTRKAVSIMYKAHKDQLDKSGVPYVFHPWHVAEQMQDEVKKYKDAVIPAIILIPGKSGSLGIGMQNITDSVERAVGADIL